MGKLTFPRARCSGCEYYIGNTSWIAVEHIRGKKLLPGVRYCAYERKARAFKKHDAKLYAPHWCPRRIPACIVRIYSRNRVSVVEMFGREEPDSAKSAAYFNPSQYDLEVEFITPFAPAEFLRRLASGLHDYYELLSGHYPRKHDVIEITNNLVSAFYYCDWQYEWKRISQFNISEVSKR